MDRTDLTENLNLTQPDKKSKSGIFFTILLIALSLLLIVVVYLNTYVFFLVEVSGESMMPTLNSGDVVTVNRKLTPKRGDIVIIEGEKQNAYLIKRVIAVGGQTVTLENGEVKIDGEIIDEPYVIERGATNATGSLSEWTLKDDEIFYMGDNRPNSKDSRDDEYGACTSAQIVGVVEGWSFSTLGINKFIYNFGR